MDLLSVGRHLNQPQRTLGRTLSAALAFFPVHLRDPFYNLNRRKGSGFHTGSIPAAAIRTLLGASRRNKGHHGAVLHTGILVSHMAFFTGSAAFYKSYFFF